MDRSMLKNLDDTLKSLAAEGLYKNERIISSPQSAKIRVDGTAGGEVLNFCSNNYLGLANHPEVVAAAKNALDRWGFGLSSVRFICGTQVIHKQLEAAISDFLGTNSWKPNNVFIQVRARGRCFNWIDRNLHLIVRQSKSEQMERTCAHDCAIKEAEMTYHDGALRGA